jgi:hypothetical protein
VDAEAFWGMGAQFRLLSMGSISLGTSMRDAIIKELSSAIHGYAANAEEALACRGCMQPWVHHVLQQVQGMVDQLPVYTRTQDFMRDVLKANDYVQESMPGSLPRMKAAVEGLHAHFTVSFVDKVRENFCVFCTKGYIQDMQKDLQQPNGAYQDITAAHPDPEQLAHDMHMHLLRDGRYDCVMKVRPVCKLPFYAATCKLHKDPVKLRYLSCSSSVVLTDPAVYLTQFFRGIQSDVYSLWHNQMLAIGYPERPGHVYMPWFIPSSAYVLPTVRDFNARRMPFSLFLQRGMQSAWDFNRLFTSLPQQDLKQRMRSLIHQVFLLHPGAAGVKVHKKKGLPLEWLNHIGPASTWCPRSDTGRKVQAQIFTEASLADLFDYIIDHTYVQFGGRLYQQHIGIPMGINFAVFLSNYYLFTYEYDFLHQLHAALHAAADVDHGYAPAATWAVLQRSDPLQPPVAPQQQPSRWEPVPQEVSRKDVARMLLDAYQYTVRYVDDLLSIANPAFSSLLYTTSVWHGFHGIYPPQLQLTPGSKGRKVVYMDLHLEALAIPAPELSGAPFASIETTLYDKCIHGPLVGLSIVKYPHITSNLSWECKYNILTTEFFRLIRNITSQSDFCLHMARIIVHLLVRGYQLQLLVSRLQDLMRRHYYHWVVPWSEVFKEVLLCIAASQLDNMFPGLGTVLAEQITLAQFLQH